MIASTGALDFAAYAKGMQGYDVEAIVGQHAIPILILTGSDDREIASNLHQLSKSRSGVSFEPIEGAGHLPNIQAPNEFNSALTAFLNRNNAKPIVNCKSIATEHD
jgi:pimeloyl-ACP methyl ester carboxylesterase